MTTGEGSELTPILVAVIGVVGVVAGSSAKSFFDNRGRDLRRNQLKTDLETIKLLEEVGDFESTDKLRAHVDGRIEELIAGETTKSRDPTAIGLGLAFVGAAALLARSLLVSDWNLILEVFLWLTVVTIALFGVVGTQMGLKRVERDDRGRAIKGSSS